MSARTRSGYGALCGQWLGRDRDTARFAANGSASHRRGALGVGGGWGRFWVSGGGKGQGLRLIWPPSTPHPDLGLFGGGGWVVGREGLGALRVCADLRWVGGDGLGDLGRKRKERVGVRGRGRGLGRRLFLRRAVAGGWLRCGRRRARRLAWCRRGVVGRSGCRGSGARGPCAW